LFIQNTKEMTKMAEEQDTITDSQIAELQEINKEFVKRRGFGLGEAMKTLLQGFREMLDSDYGGVQDPALRTLVQDDGNDPYEPDETGEENPVPESQAGIIAKARQQEIQGFFNNNGLGHIKVPVPNVSSDEFMEHRVGHEQMLFFRPATKDLSYENFMKAFGQGNHWTVTDEVGRAEIDWEPTPQGYWFWAEVQEKCPRLGTSWNDLTNKLNFHLLSLEEYVIVWHTHKTLTNTMFDKDTLSWLRTRHHQAKDLFNALHATGRDDKVNVNRYWYLAGSYGNGGGRCAEVTKF